MWQNSRVVTTPPVRGKENFTGHELDAETGMLYAGARYYMPNIGRWASVGPLAGLYPGHSPYNYVLNNPLRLVDPDGRFVDDYRLNRDGSIELVRETDDPFDVLFATNNQGDVDDQNSIQLEKGVLGNIRSSEADGMAYSYLSVTGDNTATKLFEFVSSNSSVEWSQVKYGINRNYVATGYQPHAEPGGSDLLYRLVVGRYHVREHIHSHPTSTTGPSGFDPRHPRTGSGDRALASWVHQYAPGVKLSVFEVRTGSYIRYNNRGVIRP